MQRRIGHHHAAHGDRLKPRHRRQCPGAAHLDIDGGKFRDGFFGRKLVGNGPARAARAEAEARLQIEPVDLVDHAVNIIGQFGTREPDGVVMLDQRLDAAQPFG